MDTVIHHYRTVDADGSAMDDDGSDCQLGTDGGRVHHGPPKNEEGAASTAPKPAGDVDQKSGV